MKLKFTPLLIISIGLILFGIYYILAGMGGNLGPPAGMLIIIIGFVCLLPYFILRKAFRTNTKRQIVAELLLVFIIGFIFYVGSEKVVLHVPRDFKGYIIITYGVDKKPKFKSTNWLNRDIDLTVPASGIIFTSDRDDKNIVVIDSSNSLKEVHPGYGIPFANDTLNCGNKKFPLEILVIGKLPPGWDYTTDTVKRNLSKEIACKLLSE